MSSYRSLQEYEKHNLVEVFDRLYDESKNNGVKGKDLYTIIVSEDNIMCAYNIIKGYKNTREIHPQETVIIKGYEDMSKDDFLLKVRKIMEDYHPDDVRWKTTQTLSGNKRPIAITDMEGRIIQQMIKQVIEPIAEAKFHNHSYGGRDVRSPRHAISRGQYLININKLHYVVKVDYKEVYDKVNHSKLIKQLYTMGITDKRVLSIIKKMVKGKSKETDGIQNSGVMSMLLLNIYLNELDHWLSSQWESFPTKKKYHSPSGGYRELKKTNIKEMYFTRYEDEYLVFTRSYSQANKVKEGIKRFFNKRLKVDLEEHNIKVVNTKKNAVDFIGYYIRSSQKRNKYVARTGISKLKKDKILKDSKQLIKNIQNRPTVANVNKYNSYVVTIKNYYKYATNVYEELAKIESKLMLNKYNKFTRIGKRYIPSSQELNESYKRYNPTGIFTYKIGGVFVYSFTGQSTQPNRNFSQDITKYTEEGRDKVRKFEQSLESEVVKIMDMSVYAKGRDNVLGVIVNRYIQQKGKCYVTDKFMYYDTLNIHHIKPKYLGGKDEEDNCVVVNKEIHKLIHLEDKGKIETYLGRLNLNKTELSKINKLREQCNLTNILWQ